jgi:hypothetical protein
MAQDLVTAKDLKSHFNFKMPIICDNWMRRCQRSYPRTAYSTGQSYSGRLCAASHAKRRWFSSGYALLRSLGNRQGVDCPGNRWVVCRRFVVGFLRWGPPAIKRCSPCRCHALAGARLWPGKGTVSSAADLVLYKEYHSAPFVLFESAARWEQRGAMRFSQDQCHQFPPRHPPQRHRQAYRGGRKGTAAGPQTSPTWLCFSRRSRIANIDRRLTELPRSRRARLAAATSRTGPQRRRWAGIAVPRAMGHPHTVFGEE